MNGTPPDDALEQARRDSGLSTNGLWIRYFALGGSAEPLTLEAVLHGALDTSDLEHDQVAHTLNERFTELGRNHPVPYRRPELADPEP